MDFDDIDRKKIIREIRDNQQRGRDLGAAAPIFTAYHPDVPDARVKNHRKRGNISHPRYGLMSKMYCVKCGKPSNFLVSESMLKVFYQCNECTLTSGDPLGAVKVIGTDHM